MDVLTRLPPRTPVGSRPRRCGLDVTPSLRAPLRLGELLAAHFAVGLARLGSAFVMATSELADNAVIHGRNEVGAYVAAQRYKTTRCVLSIGDLGVGIPEHLRRAYPHLTDDGLAIVGLETRGAGRQGRASGEQPMRIELASYGRVFSTRDHGLRLLAEIEHELSGAESIVVDFRDVLSVSYSFADEFVGGLAQRAQAGATAHVTVEHADGSIRDTIELSLRKRGIEPAEAELAPA